MSIISPKNLCFDYVERERFLAEKLSHILLLTSVLSIMLMESKYRKAI